MNLITEILKKHKKDFEKRLDFNGGPDYKIGCWKFIAIHQIPKKILIGNEFDFWCHNQQYYFLLRIRKSKLEQISATKDKGALPIYLVAEVYFKTIDEVLLKSIINQYEKLNITNYTLNKIKKTIKNK